MSDLATTIQGIKFTSIAAAGEQVRAVGIARADLGPAIGIALQKSTTSGLRLARGIFATMTTQEAGELPAIVDWASKASSNERQLLSTAARLDGASLMLIHQISTLPGNSATSFVADYFAAGGEMRPVAQWLQIAGGVLRKHSVKQAGTDGFVVDAVEWVVDKVEDVVDATVEGISSLANAVASAAKSLVEVVVETISWTVEQIADLVTALIQATKSVAEILAAAAAQGVDALKKFVKGVIKAGLALGEVLAWAVGQAIEATIDVVRALRDVGKSFGEILAWAAAQAIDAAGAIFRALKAVGQSLVQIVGAAFTAGLAVLKATLAVMLQAGETLFTIVKTLVTQPWNIFTVATKALLELGYSVVSLLDQAAQAALGTLSSMVQALKTLGSAVVDLAEWAVNKTVEVMGAVVEGVRKAGTALVDFVTAIAGRAFAVMRKVVEALLEVGNSFVGLMIDFADMAVDAFGKFIKAGLELGQTLASVIAKTLECTYKLSAKLIRGALAAGIKVAELLADVAGKTYWTLRKMVHGILKALGPIGEVLDWVLSQAEGAVAAVLRPALEAIRYAGGKLSTALDWALAKGEAVLEATLAAWESIGEALTKAYDWARKQGLAIWETIGRITTTLKNSVSFVLLYLEKDFIPGIAKFVKGALAAGAVLADFMVTLAKRPFAIALEVTKSLLAAGVTLGALLVETIQHPGQGLENLLRAVKTLGQTTKDIFKAMTVDAAKALIEDVTLTLHDLKEPVVDMLEAAAEVGAGLVGTVVSVLLNTLASYRPLTALEKADGKRIFGNSLDLDKIYVSAESLTNKVIFGLQDWFRGQEDSRPFTTDTLINFDVDDGIKRYTLIHELTHVWQALETGPFYMAQAIHAQNTDDKYNYGYSDEATTVDLASDYVGGTEKVKVGKAYGKDGGDALKAGGGKLGSFNVEQQAQIAMHYYVRRYLLNMPANDYADWQPYVDELQAA
jgi:hypothetical protein